MAHDQLHQLGPLVSYLLWDKAKPVGTPFAVNMKLRVKAEDNESVDKKNQSALGSLLYLITRTRPDNAFVVNSIAHFS